MKTTACLAVLLYLVPLTAASYYVDPASGSIGNDGSETSPWDSLHLVASSKTFTPGDTVYLRSGYHGTVSISGTYDPPVVFMAQPGEVPLVRQLTLNSNRVIIDGLTITPPVLERVTLITVKGAGNVVQNCSLYTVADASVWHIGHWNYYSCNGFSVSGPRSVIRNNLIKNVDFGISVGYNADSTLVEYTTIENFSGDGIRGLADHSVYQYNVVKNCYAVNANHDDGFQSWSYQDGTVGTGVVYGVVLRGNLIINYEDINQPLRGTLQGIGCFDGMFEGWLIENNVVFTDHYHGITLLGATDCVIINNTVGDLNTVSPGAPWIQIGDHKDGRGSTGLIRNNLTTKISGLSTGVRQDHNIIYSDYNEHFVDYAGYNFYLKEGSPAVDAGSDSLAPAMDRAGNPRPYGNAIDVGAYEYGYSPVKNIRPRPAAEPRMTNLPNPATFKTIWDLKPGVRVFTIDGTELPPGEAGETGVYYLKMGKRIIAAVIIN